jgi:mono/diheme cytochrome c family protein
MLNVGCEQPPAEVDVVSFEPNYVYAHATSIREDDVDTTNFLKDIDRLMVDWFGTPDAPKIPEVLSSDDDLKDLISLDNLTMAAGPAPATAAPGNVGLFRQQCATCHGETGQGRGVVAASQNPYPRDFRKGFYKYKTTGRNSKPTRDDLKRTLVQGMEGTQMPKFDKLNDQQINAIVDYIIYLSIRGELERKLLAEAAYEYSPNMPLFDKAKADAETKVKVDDDEEVYNKELYEEQMELAQTELTDIATTWLDATDEVEELDEPEQTVVAGLDGQQDVDAAELEASIARGKSLFVNTTAACSKCHGETGNGIGSQLPDYDDWTKEWTAQINIDPKSQDDVLPFLVRGAMQPQPLPPRNLIEGKLRGGRDPASVYHRLRFGIAGSPMPAATLKQGDAPGLTSDDLWDLVNYVLSLKQATPIDTKLATK